MAEIIKVHKECDCVSNLKGYVSDDNEVTLMWDWPENEEYDLCIVFDLEQENESLAMLLERKAKRTVYANEFGVCHKSGILASFAQFRVYPAKRVDGSIHIVDQKAKNLSAAFHKKVRLEYRIEYQKPKLFASYRRARILLGNLEQVVDGYLCYRCLGGGKDSTIFGIDLASFTGQNGFEIVVGKEETVELYLEEEQTNHLELVRC